jgi:hypothetical protein
LWTYVRDQRPFAGKRPPADCSSTRLGRKSEHPRDHLRAFRGVSFMPMDTPGSTSCSLATASPAACGAHPWTGPQAQDRIRRFGQQALRRSRKHDALTCSAAETAPVPAFRVNGCTVVLPTGAAATSSSAARAAASSSCNSNGRAAGEPAHRTGRIARGAAWRSVACNMQPAPRRPRPVPRLLACLALGRQRRDRIGCRHAAIVTRRKPAPHAIGG